MASTSSPPILSWTKDNRYLISTDPSLLPLASLNNDIFGAEDFTWGKPLPIESLRILVDRSLCFGLYVNEVPSDQKGSEPLLSKAKTPTLIGFARLITDLTTVHYLTDVYIVATYRSHGLGAWLMRCIDEVFRSGEHLRGMILISDRGSRNEEFYRRCLGMGDLAGAGFCMDRKGKGA